MVDLLISFCFCFGIFRTSVCNELLIKFKDQLQFLERNQGFHLTNICMCYLRQLFHASDGGTIALDWLMSTDGNVKRQHQLGDCTATATATCKQHSHHIFFSGLFLHQWVSFLNFKCASVLAWQAELIQWLLFRGIAYRRIISM